MNVCPIPPTKYNANNINHVNNVNFSGIKEQNTGGFLPAVSSLVLPGLGQYMNNDGSKGAFYMLSAVASTIAAAFATKSVMKRLGVTAQQVPEIVRANAKKLPVVAAILTATGIIGPTLRLLSFVDAYKGKTSADIKKIPVPVPVPVYAGESGAPVCRGCDCEDC
ncbi:MAG: hypothetical protein PHX18_01960 [Candidatus Gastranaerophilales bacterium]|nr:hypothetical protein [Candidatus Gastranaerophilales bacterium]